MTTGRNATLEREPEVTREITEEPRVLREAEVLTMTPHRPRVDQYLWGGLRIMMGWIFAWPFLDKLFGLGFATERADAWVDGGSPTTGFLQFATIGPFAEFFENMAGNAFVDWLFMLGLAGVGIALMLGVGVRVGAITGATMLLLMYAASAIWPEHNPFLDDHLVYAFIMLGLAFTNAGRYLGLGGMWTRTRLVMRYRFLE